MTIPPRRCLKVLTVLSGVAQSAYKMCGDVRLLANLKEIEEPFAKTQVPIGTQRYISAQRSNSLLAGDFATLISPRQRNGHISVSIE